MIMVVCRRTVVGRKKDNTRTGGRKIVEEKMGAEYIISFSDDRSIDRAIRGRLVVAGGVVILIGAEVVIFEVVVPLVPRM